MRRSFSSRALLVVCCVLAGLLLALAAVQYRWSTRVAIADVEREKEHLESAAALFAGEFNRIAGEVMDFLHEGAYAALQSGEPLTGVPKFIGELYYLHDPENGKREARRLTAAGLFEPTPMPEWIGVPRCAALVTAEPPALVAPIYDVARSESHQGGQRRLLRTVRMRTDRCFVAQIDKRWLREELFPQLIRQSFGETAAREYDFAVAPLARPKEALYGEPGRVDLRKAFFPVGLRVAMPPENVPSAPGQAVVIQRLETVVRKGPADLRDTGVWELQIAHKGVPLAAAFERNRRRDLLLSLGVEVLLIAAIAFLVIGARRMQQLADQKMRFVAGVSHELRTPVSAIAMLSRNQADGLVAGADKVRRYGELIHQQSRRLNEMVEQTLQYAGIHSGLRKPAKQEIDLARLLQEAVASRSEELERGGFHVEIAFSPGLPPLVGDANLLRTAFDNLLDNALKHATGGRWIRVSAQYAAPDKEVCISVEDRGAGIDPADQVEIFEPFSRGRAAVEAQIPGSGLGLSLVRSAAEAHRGSVTLVSAPGRGSTFTMRLPA